MGEVFAAVRPGDWWVLDLHADPVPGDPFTVRRAAVDYLQLAEDADLAFRHVGSLAGDPVALEWIGASGDAFRQQIGDLPRDLRKLSLSYQLAGDALAGYAAKLSEAQAQADHALTSGRVARQWLNDAQALEASAQASLEAAKAQMYSLWHSSVPTMDEARLTAAKRNIEVAESRLALATREKRQARAEVDAARQLALQAAAVRDAAAVRCANEIEAASDAGIRNKPWWSWQKVSRTIGAAWSVAVQVCKVVGAVVLIAGLVLGGPVLLWVALAAAMVVLLDTLARFADGKSSFEDVICAVVDAIPAGRIAGVAWRGKRTLSILSHAEAKKMRTVESTRMMTKDAVNDDHRRPKPAPSDEPKLCVTRMARQVRLSSAALAP
jgi:hypothetical protein